MTEQKKYISQVNSHVEDYLDYYCGLSHSPWFAVLLKGEWGCGKTWFINKYCEKLEKKKEGEVSEGKLSHRNILSKAKNLFTSVIPRKKSQREKYDEFTKKTHLYVSLYGMTNTTEIEDEFFRQLHPLLSSKGMAITGKVLRLLIKASFKIDLNSDGKDNETLTLQIPKIDVPESFKKADESILIFDDLERCQIDLGNILGYINYFVEHQGQKVVLVANEEQLLEKSSDEKENKNEYEKIKEKLIGKTFEIGFDLHNALQAFIEEVDEPKIKVILRDNTQLIEEIYQIAEYQNLRSLKQIILDFERIFRELPEKAKDKPELLQEILKILTAFSIEIKRGNLPPKDLGKLQEAEKHREKQPMSDNISNVGNDYQNRLSDNERKKFSDLQEITNKYNCIKDLIYEFFEPILNLSWWQNFFDKGIISENFQEIISNSRYFIDDSRPNWIKLWHFDELNDDEFEELLKKVESEYANRKFTDIGEIKHVTGIFFNLSEQGLYSKTKQQLLQSSKDYIDDLIAENKLDINPSLDASWLVESMTPYQGLGFRGKELKEFKEFCDYLKKARQSAIEKNLPNMSLELLHIMQNDVQQFKRMICSNNSSSKANALDQRYIRVPILKYIKPQDFVDRILSMSFDNQATCLSGLQARYKFEEYSKNLVEELEWLKNVQNLLMQEANSRQGKLSGKHLKDLNEYYLNGAIASLEKYKLDGEQHGINDK